VTKLIPIIFQLLRILKNKFEDVVLTILHLSKQKKYHENKNHPTICKLRNLSLERTKACDSTAVKIFIISN
jgi:hypothetical protein